jgi:hypothetical protein
MVSYSVDDGRLFFGLTRKHSGSWQEFFDLLNRIEIPDDFLREREDTVPQDREGLILLAGDIEFWGKR